MGKEGVRKVEQFWEVKICPWKLVGTLVKEVWRKDVPVIRMEALPEELVALSLGHEMVEN